MICDICNKRQATIEFTAIAGDAKKTLHLCQECSKQQGQKTEPVKLAHVPTDAKKVDVVIGQLAGAEAGKGLCPGCGMTYEEFRKVGRLGCSQCYAAFGTPLRRLLKRIHGSDLHVGRGPRAPTPVPEHGDSRTGTTAVNAEDLRSELAAAVNAEDYERAADLRDRIARLQEEGS
ncbi:MAG: UvrB/UvrC motif-containing protein [bacterium]|nr:UvrB/UvrC motif-containing protein [bacterium]